MARAVTRHIYSTGTLIVKTFLELFDTYDSWAHIAQLHTNQLAHAHSTSVGNAAYMSLYVCIPTHLLKLGRDFVGVYQL